MILLFLKFLLFCKFPNLYFWVTTWGYYVRVVFTDTEEGTRVSKYFALNFLSLPVPECYETWISSQCQSVLVDFFKSKYRILTLVLVKFLLELVVLVDIPNPDGGIVSWTGDFLSVVEKNDLGDLFLVSSVAMHQGEFLPFPNADDLLFLEGDKYEELLWSNDAIGLSAVGVDFAEVFDVDWKVRVLILEELVDEYFGLIGANIECVLENLQSADWFFEDYGLGDPVAGGVLLDVVLGEELPWGIVFLHLINISFLS